MSSKSARIAILGAGSWGTALAITLARNGHSILLWAKDTESLRNIDQKRENMRYLPGIRLHDLIQTAASLQAALTESDEILICVPSHAFRSVLTQMKPHLTDDQAVTWATKGLDADSRFLHEVAHELLGKRPMALITGPSFAKEVAQNLPTAVLIASTHGEYAKRMQALFQSSYFRVYLSNDLIGAEIGGAVKNVLALAVGIAEGLGFGTNTKAALITRGLAEMLRLGETLGAKRETLTGLSGLGDLILTCSDTQSRNLRFGIMLGQGVAVDEACKSIGQVVESIATSKLVFNLAQKHNVRMPIATQVYAILYEALLPQEAIRNLLEASVGWE